MEDKLVVAVTGYPESVAILGSAGAPSKTVCRGPAIAIVDGGGGGGGAVRDCWRGPANPRGPKQLLASPGDKMRLCPELYDFTNCSYYDHHQQKKAGLEKN